VIIFFLFRGSTCSRSSELVQLPARRRAAPHQRRREFHVHVHVPLFSTRVFSLVSIALQFIAAAANGQRQLLIPTFSILLLVLRKSFFESRKHLLKVERTLSKLDHSRLPSPR
jgi:hypothetical protein